MFPLLTVYMDQHVLPASPAHNRRQSYDDSVVAAVTLDARNGDSIAAASGLGHKCCSSFFFAHTQEAMEFSSFGAKLIIPKP